MPHSITSTTFRPEYSFDSQSALNPPYANSYIGSAPSSRRNSMQSNANVARRQSLAASDAGRGDSDVRSVTNGSIHNGISGTPAFYSSVAKSRSKGYHEEQSTPRETSAIRDKIHRESPVIAELRTNVIVKDEFTLVTDLSSNLAKRYNRLEAAIMVKVDHSCCLAYGGTFDPCYVLHISAIYSQMGPAMNKRNAAVLQSFLADILSVPPDRGIVKFDPLPEENLAANGTTVLGEIDRQEKNAAALESRRNSTTATSRRSVASMPRSAAAPKLDLDFNLPSLGDDSFGNYRTLDSLAESTTSSRTQSMAAGPYEIPTPERTDQRPNTSHGPAGRKSSNSWLRTNSLRSDIVSSIGRLPNGRPKTISGADDLDLLSTAPQLPQLNLSSTSNSNSNSSPSRKDRLSVVKADLQAKWRSTPTPQPSQQSLDGGKADSFLDSVIGAPGQLTTIGDLRKQSADAAEKAAAPIARRKAATAPSSRRQSVSATPAMPVVPPTPVDAARPRISKRKSFLSAFRRPAREVRV